MGKERSGVSFYPPVPHLAAAVWFARSAEIQSLVCAKREVLMLLDWEPGGRLREVPSVSCFSLSMLLETQLCRVLKPPSRRKDAGGGETLGRENRSCGGKPGSCWGQMEASLPSSCGSSIPSSPIALTLTPSGTAHVGHGLLSGCLLTQEASLV